MVYDVWDSQEDFEALGQVLMPILGELGIDAGQPDVMPVHNVVQYPASDGLRARRERERVDVVVGRPALLAALSGGVVVSPRGGSGGEVDGGWLSWWLPGLLALAAHVGPGDAVVGVELGFPDAGVDEGVMSRAAQDEVVVVGGSVVADPADVVGLGPG